MPITTVEFHPQVIGGSGDVTIVGGDHALEDGSDATYVQTVNLEVAGSFAIVGFPGVALPPGAKSDCKIRARYEQVSGLQSARPRLGLRPLPWTRQMTTTTLASTGDGIVEEEGPWLFGGSSPFYSEHFDLFSRDPIIPTSWDMTYDYSTPDGLGGPCDFRVYEITWIVQFLLPDQDDPRLIYPRKDAYGARVWPPPNNPQSGARFGSAAPL